MKLRNRMTAVLMSAAILGAGLTVNPVPFAPLGAPMTAQAEGDYDYDDYYDYNNEVTVGDLKFYLDDDQAVVLGRSDTKAASITIPAEVNGLPVTGIANGAFRHIGYIFDRDYPLKSVTIPDSVEVIGSEAFYYCWFLENITIPDSVKTIGDQAFMWCDALKSVTIPDSVTYIGAGAFNSCYHLTDIVISNSIDTIPRDAFYYCLNVTKITIPDSVISIGAYAFAGCVHLTEITIPESVTYIDESAFEKHELEILDFTEELIIRGYPGSYAEQYAAENNISFRVPGIPLQDSDVTLSETEFRYAGGEVKVDQCITVMSGSTKLKYGTDYTITYANNTVPGTATVKVSGIGEYEGSVTKHFIITPPGDVDCDGRLTIADAILLARYLAEDPVSVSAVGLLNAEQDGDSSALTAGDLTVLMEGLAGNTTLH